MAISGNLIFSYTTLMTGTDAPVLSAAVYARITADTEGKSLGVQRQLRGLPHAGGGAKVAGGA